jgi:hypothetical protein
MSSALVLVALLALWKWGVHRQANGGRWTSLWLALTTTALAAAFVAAGVAGLSLDAPADAFEAAPWSATVIWWEVAVGIALLPLSVSLGRRALQRSY